MIEQVFHLLTGYAEFEIEGDSPRFLNLAVKSGFGLWGFQKREGRARARIKAREYKKLRPVCKRCGARLRLTRKRGVPFQALRLRRRKGLLLGALLGAGIYGFLSCFVWGVDVSGAVEVPERQILEAAEKRGICAGALKERLRGQGAAHGIAADIGTLTWISVNTDGCFVEIAVRESEKKPKITDDSRWSNIVAAREGAVVSIEAERGRPEVELGEPVKKGDLLISGLYEEMLEPWDPRAGSPLKTSGAARGSVKAETYRGFTVQVGAVKREKVPEGKKRSNISLSLLGLRLPLGLNLRPEGEYRRYTEAHTVTALGEKLPITLYREVYEPLIEEKRPLTEEEQKEAALRKLREAQRAAMPAGSKVLREELSYTFAGGLCVLEAKCHCLEEIGEVQEILVE